MTSKLALKNSWKNKKNCSKFLGHGLRYQKLVHLCTSRGQTIKGVSQLSVSELAQKMIDFQGL